MNKLFIDAEAIDKALAAWRPEVLDGYVQMACRQEIPCAQIEILTDMKIEQLRPHVHMLIKTYLENANG